MNKTFSSREVLRESWNEVTKDLKFFVLLSLGAWVVQFVPSYLTDQVTNPIASFLLSLASWLLSTAVTICLIAISLKHIKTGKATLADAKEKMAVFGTYLLGSIYYSFIVLLGLILLIVPGVIWAIRYQFYGYFIINEGLKSKEALAKSKEITKDKTGKLIVFGLALMGINLLGALALGVGLLITIPMSLIAVAKVYLALTTTEAKPEVTPQATNNPSANVWRTYRQN